MTVTGTAQCGYCGSAYRTHDETTTTTLEGYEIVREAGECPHCATPTTHPETIVLEHDAEPVPAGGQR